MVSSISSKKGTKNFDITTMIPQVDLFFFIFCRKSKTPKKTFWNYLTFSSSLFGLIFYNFELDWAKRNHAGVLSEWINYNNLKRLLYILLVLGLRRLGSRIGNGFCHLSFYVNEEWIIYYLVFKKVKILSTFFSTHLFYENLEQKLHITCSALC